MTNYELILSDIQFFDDWLFIINKMPRTLMTIKELALEKEDYEKLHLINLIENLKHD